MRLDNKLSKGKCNIKIFNRNWSYDGELDKNNQPCGTGEAVAHNVEETYKGNFFNGLPNGIGEMKTRVSHADSTWLGEYKNGKKFGKITYKTPK